jgi:uncharacterized membrane protein YkoI
MALRRRMYWILALVAIMTLAGAAITVTSRITSASGPTPTPAVQPCDQQDEADDASESAAKGADTDNIEEQCGDQNEADDASESTAKGPDTDNIAEQTGDQNEADDSTEQHQSGVLDDGKDLLPQASITLDQAIAAAQSAASGPVGEVDLEQYQGKLVFNVDIGDKDVKVDAQTGAALSADSTD